MHHLDHPHLEYAVGAGLLVAAGGTLFWNLTRANNVHELAVAPAVLVLALLSAAVTWRGVWALSKASSHRSWLAYGVVQGLLCAAASVGALRLFLLWIQA